MTPELEREWWKAEGARMSIYISLFPWFGPALMEADWGSDTASPRVQVVMRRADKEWTARTHLSPLTSMAAWKRALIAIRYPARMWKHLSWSEMQEAIDVWVIVRRAEAARERMARER